MGFSNEDKRILFSLAVQRSRKREDADILGGKGMIKKTREIKIRVN